MMEARTLKARRRAPIVLSIGLIIAIAGCSASGSVTPSGAAGGMYSRGRLISTDGVRALGDLSASGGNGLFANAMPAVTVGRDLFVSSEVYPNSAMRISVYSNKAYKRLGKITKGLDDNVGVWVDAKGNLYVANYMGPNVTEYAVGTKTPKCTYSSSLTSPVKLTTDITGNVYVADFAPGGSGAVYEYGQCKNAVSKKYSVFQPEGVAVDSHGNIFVAYATQSVTGALEEFKRGKSTPIQLKAKLGVPSSLLLDHNRNLIVDDQVHGQIDVVAPPYQTATPLVTGLSTPLDLSLNKAENLLFSSNYGTTTVTVYQYPSGALLTTLNPPANVWGVADSPNAVF